MTKTLTMWSIVRLVPLGSIVLLITCYTLPSTQTCDPQSPYSCILDINPLCRTHWTTANFYEATSDCFSKSCFEARTNQSKLTSTLACKTGNNNHCLSFYHKFRFDASLNEKFTIYLHIGTTDYSNLSYVLYKTINASDNTEWTLHRIDIKATVDFKVVFTHITPRWEGLSLIDGIEYVRSQCNTITTITTTQGNENAIGTSVSQNLLSTLSHQSSSESSSNPGGIAAAVIIIVFFIALLVVVIVLYRRGKLPFLKKLPCTKHNLNNCLNRQDKHVAEPSQGDGYEVPKVHVKDLTISGPLELQTTTGPASGPHGLACDKSRHGLVPTKVAVPSETFPGPPGGYHNYPLGQTLENDTNSVYNEPDDEIYHTIEDSESSEASFDEDDDSELPQYDVQRAPEADNPTAPALYQTPKKSNESKVDTPRTPALYQTPRKKSEPKNDDGAGIHQSVEDTRSDDVTPSFQASLYHVLENKPRDHDVEGETPDRNSVYNLAKALESAMPAPSGGTTQKPGRRQGDYNRLQLKGQRSRGEGEEDGEGESGGNKGEIGKVYHRLAGDDYHAVNLQAKQTVIDGDYSHIQGHAQSS